MQRSLMILAGLLMLSAVCVARQKGTATADAVALLGNGCGITDEAAPFGIVIARGPNGVMQVSWESCSTHAYGVYITEQLSRTNGWSARRWFVGRDGSTSWLDAEAATRPARFYCVRRLSLGGDADSDGLANQDEIATYGSDPVHPDTDRDGMPDRWEAVYGLSLLDPSNAGTDHDGDGVTDLIEYLQGRNPTAGAVTDTARLLNLEVFTPLE